MPDNHTHTTELLTCTICRNQISDKSNDLEPQPKQWELNPHMLPSSLVQGWYRQQQVCQTPESTETKNAMPVAHNTIWELTLHNDTCNHVIIPVLHVHYTLKGEDRWLYKLKPIQQSKLTWKLEQSQKCRISVKRYQILLGLTIAQPQHDHVYSFLFARMCRSYSRLKQSQCGVQNAHMNLHRHFQTDRWCYQILHMHSSVPHIWLVAKTQHCCVE